MFVFIPLARTGQNEAESHRVEKDKPGSVCPFLTIFFEVVALLPIIHKAI